MTRAASYVLMSIAIAACAGERPSSTISSSDVSAYDQAAVQIGAAVDVYRSSATTMSTPAECSAALTRYAGDVQPMVDRMQQMSKRMDDAMRSMSMPMGADMACGGSTMHTELDQHRAVACGLGDMAANRAEAVRHCDAMAEFTDHMRMRAAEMEAMVGTGSGTMMGGGAMGPGMMDGGMGAGMDGGWRMPDGGMMDWDHAMPGCTLADGGFAPPDGGYWSDGGWMMDGGMHQ